MIIIDNAFEVPLEIASRPIPVNDLFKYVRCHQNNTTLYRSEFAVRRVLLVLLALMGSSVNCCLEIYLRNRR